MTEQNLSLNQEGFVTNDSEQDIVVEKIRALRNRVIRSLKEKNPIFLPQLIKNGDDFIQRAACMVVLRRLCTEERIELPEIFLSATDKNQLELSEATLIITSWHKRSPKLNDLQGRRSYFCRQMRNFAEALGVTLTQEDWESIPPIVPTDAGPLKNYQEQVVSKRSEELRGEIGNREVITVCQAGSEGVKRLNNTQVTSLVEAIKLQKPNAFVVVITDRRLLEDSLLGNDLQINGRISIGFPVRRVVTDQERYSIAQVRRFKEELEKPIVAGQENKIDRVVEIGRSDVNELLSYLHSSCIDRRILGALGCNPKYRKNFCSVYYL